MSGDARASNSISRHAWASLTTTEVAEFVGRDPVVVLPLASTEQHGPHLPLSTDLDIGAGVLAEALDRLEDDVPVRVLPTLAVGASMEHMGMAGTISRSNQGMARTIREVGETLARSGVRRLVLSNSHGGNQPAMDQAALELREAEGMLVVKASYARFPRPGGIFPESEWTGGLHGGALETSMMLYLSPDLVREDVIRDWGAAYGAGTEAGHDLEHLAPEGTVSFGWLARDLHPSGVAGDPTIADAEKGERLVRHYGGILAEVIRDARAFPLARLR